MSQLNSAMLYGAARRPNLMRPPTRFAPPATPAPASAPAYGAANALGPAPTPPAPVAAANNVPLGRTTISNRPLVTPVYQPLQHHAPIPQKPMVTDTRNPNSIPLGTPGAPVANWLQNNQQIQVLNPANNVLNPPKAPQTPYGAAYGTAPAPTRPTQVSPGGAVRPPALPYGSYSGAAPAAPQPTASTIATAGRDVPLAAARGAAAPQPTPQAAPQPSSPTALAAYGQNIPLSATATSPVSAPGWTSTTAGGPGNPAPPPPTPANLAQTGNPQVDAQISAVQQQQAQANAANQQRYDELLRLNDQGGAGQLQDQTATLSGLQNTIDSGQSNKLGYLGAQQDYLNNMLGGQKSDELGFIDTQHGVTTGLANQYGDVEHQREDLALKSQLGALNQYAINSGLNTTSAPLAGMGQAFDTSALRQQAIDEDKANRMLGVEEQYTGQRLGTMSNLDASALGLNQGFANQGYGAVSDASNQTLSADSAYGQQRAGTLANLQNQRSGIIESRTDQGPDVGLTAGLLSQARGGAFLPAYGQAGYGYGGGFGGGALMPRGANRGGGFSGGSSKMGGFDNSQPVPQTPQYSSSGSPSPKTPSGLQPVPPDIAANNPGYAGMTTINGMQYLVTQDGQLVPMS